MSHLAVAVAEVVSVTLLVISPSGGGTDVGFASTLIELLPDDAGACAVLDRGGFPLEGEGDAGAALGPAELADVALLLSCAAAMPANTEVTSTSAADTARMAISIVGWI